MIEKRSMKTVTMTCCAAGNEAKLSFLKPKPPVPAVAKAVLTASKRLMPEHRRVMNIITVIAK